MPPITLRSVVTVSCSIACSGFGDLVGGRPRVGDREVDDGVDADHEVVLGDHRLRRERDDLLAQVDQRLDAVDERDDQRQPRVQRAASSGPSRSTIPARACGTIRTPDAATMNTNSDQDDQCDQACGHAVSLYSLTSAVAPRISRTCTRVPGSMTSSSSYGARGPDLAVELHAADALGVGDALDDRRGLPDQRRRARLQRLPRALVRAGDRAQRGEQDDRDDEERGRTRSSRPAPTAASSAATAAPPANGARKKPSGGDLADGEHHRRDQPEHPGFHVLIRSYPLPGVPRYAVSSALGEVVGVERAQILELLADADQLDGDARARWRSPARCRPWPSRRAW